MRIIYLILGISIAGCVTMPAWAFEVYFTNGDKLSGRLVREEKSSITLHTLSTGEITVNKAFVDMAKTFPPEPAIKEDLSTPVETTKPAVINKTVSLGLRTTNGSTKTTQGRLSADFNRKTSYDETTFRYNAYYSSYNKKTDGRKFYGIARYAYSIGEDKKWYQSFKMEGDQDRFANVDYRFIPSTGAGYWLSTADSFKVMSEVSIGYQYTHYTINVKDRSELILVPHLLLDKQLLGKMRLAEDLTVYPSLSDIEHYRVRSETSVINPLNENWDFKVQFIYDFDSIPETAKKTQLMWITALDYRF